MDSFVWGDVFMGCAFVFYTWKIMDSNLYDSLDVI
jgi:hypothetical protein